MLKIIITMNELIDGSDYIIISGYVELTHFFRVKRKEHLFEAY